MMTNGNGSRGRELTTSFPRAMAPRDVAEHRRTDYSATAENYAPTDFAPADERTQVNLHKLAREIEKLPLDRIAELTLALTYGEMIEAAEGITALFKEKGVDVSEQVVASILHDWSKRRQVAR